MRNKYTILIILVALSVCLIILISLHKGDSGKLIYVPPNEADLTLQTATVKNLESITQDSEEQRLIKNVVDSYLKKYYTAPTQSPEVVSASKTPSVTSDNDVLSYSFNINANGDIIVVTIQHQNNLWIQVTANDKNKPSQIYQQYQSLVPDPSFEGN